MAPSERVRQRFWARIEILGPDDCWLWTGPRDADRVGLLVEPFEGLTEARQAAWYFVNGPISDGLWVRHYCEDPRCCNPKHLFAAAEREHRTDPAPATASTRRRSGWRRTTDMAARDRLRRGHTAGDVGVRRFV